MLIEAGDQTRDPFTGSTPAQPSRFGIRHTRRNGENRLRPTHDDRGRVMRPAQSLQHGAFFFGQETQRVLLDTSHPHTLHLWQVTH
jgi:hypothetical protein